MVVPTFDVAPALVHGPPTPFTRCAKAGALETIARAITTRTLEMRV